ncbi:hypothetical protein BGZ61DRAFT_147797 [Ilyonectria robusta]|uniref:uncharacterized protein n=1 Tax=Ilyonectria robusta TaxID=1079257 RepID=UPI001E8EE83A|nr:uncharacterized protein BGZ61DRAFT_147797 [Ilyonectria robusta]KAH8661770.1 hypothetical protein BGZ61DRAFT_147797 [Ilyonectria robusta]
MTPPPFRISTSSPASRSHMAYQRPRNRRKSQESTSLSETGASALVSDVPKPRKRGRKPKVEPKEPAKARRKQKGESNDDEDLPRDPRRRRILERNCVLMQKYIANEARKSVDGLLSCSSAFQLSGGLTPPHHRGSSGSRTSGTDSLSIQTPEMESAPPTWTDPFQQGSRSSEVGDDLFDMVLEPFQKEPLPAPSQSISNVPSLSRCDQGVFGSSGPQPQPVVGMVWESQWGFH